MMATRQVSITVLCDGLCNAHHKNEKHPLVEAAMYTKIPGLAFHEVIRNKRDSELIGPYSEAWSVTHVKSGYRIGPPFSSRRRCMEYIKRISDLINWNKNEKSVRVRYKNLSQDKKNIILEI